jgi:hypothetical protein
VKIGLDGSFIFDISNIKKMAREVKVGAADDKQAFFVEWTYVEFILYHVTSFISAKLIFKDKHVILKISIFPFPIQNMCFSFRVKVILRLSLLSLFKLLWKNIKF